MATSGGSLRRASRRLAPSVQPQSSEPQWAAAAQVGSWFAVRVMDDGARSTVTLYGKPTVNGTELCGEGDEQLKDAKYECIEVKVREDWPATQLVEGREEGPKVGGKPVTVPNSMFDEDDDEPGTCPACRSTAELQQAFADYRRTGFGGWPWPDAAPTHGEDGEATGRFARHVDGRVERPSTPAEPGAAGASKR